MPIHISQVTKFWNLVVSKIKVRASSTGRRCWTQVTISHATSPYFSLQIVQAMSITLSSWANILIRVQTRKKSLCATLTLSKGRRSKTTFRWLYVINDNTDRSSETTNENSIILSCNTIKLFVKYSAGFNSLEAKTLNHQKHLYAIGILVKQTIDRLNCGLGWKGAGKPSTPFPAAGSAYFFKSHINV